MESRDKNVRYTQQDIANDLGLSVTTVTQCLKEGSKYCAATREKVLAYAKQVGYDKAANIQHRVLTANEAKANILASGNRPLTAYRKRIAMENARMLEMRKCGYTNAMIAKKSGYEIGTIEHRIGCQPACITAASRKLAGETAKRKNTIRKALAEKLAIETYNEMVSEAQSHIRALNDLKTKMEAYKGIKPELKLLK